MAKRKFKYVRLSAGAPASKKRRTVRKQAGAPAFALTRTGGFLGKEVKFIDKEVEQQTVVHTVAGSESDPTGDCLNATAQGDGETNRDGRRQFTHSVMVKGNVGYLPLGSGGSTFDFPFVKIALVLDTQTNGATINAEDVFVDPTATRLDSCLVRNLQYTSRFKVLKIITVKFHTSNYQAFSTTTETVGWMNEPFNIYYNFKTPLLTTYTNTTAVIANIADHSLHLIAIKSFQENQDSNAIDLNYYSRCRFTSG